METSTPYLLAPERCAGQDFLLRSIQPGDGARLAEAVNASYAHLKAFMSSPSPDYGVEEAERKCRESRGSWLSAADEAPQASAQTAQATTAIQALMGLCMGFCTPASDDERAFAAKCSSCEFLGACSGGVHSRLAHGRVPGGRCPAAHRCIQFIQRYIEEQGYGRDEVVALRQDGTSVEAKWRCRDLSCRARTPSKRYLLHRPSRRAPSVAAGRKTQTCCCTAHRVSARIEYRSRWPSSSIARWLHRSRRCRCRSCQCTG